MMKGFFFFLLALGLSGLGALRADETVQAAQRRLKGAGFYFGDATGVYDEDTAAAVTRYQIRHGLGISGQLDAATTQALGVSAPKTAGLEPVPASGTWRRLRNGDMEFLQQLNAGDIPPPGAGASSAARSPAPPGVVAPPAKKPQLELHAPPPRLAEDMPRFRSTSDRAPSVSPADYGLERLRDYVGAFVLAGLDPKIGAELEFFAERVDYFGEKNVGRKKIQADLLRYARQWPERHFRLAGEPEVEERPGGVLKVTFPLHYELRNSSKHASGQVLKTLTLRKLGGGDLQIVAVNEKKGRATGR